MKTLTILFALLSISFTSSAQDVYTTKMSEALTFYSTVNSVKDYQDAADKFDLIANGATNEWLPNYYYALCHIMMCFNDQNGTIAERDAYLAEAESRLLQLREKFPNEAEIIVLQGLLYTATLVVDPSNRGQKYSGLTRVTLEKALKIEPNNPRAKQMLLSNKVGTAQFFGQDLSEFCEEAQAQLDHWNDYTPKSPFHPTWGRNQLNEIINNCPKNDVSNQTESAQNKLTLTLNFSNLKTSSGSIMVELIDESENRISGGIGKIDGENCSVVLENLQPGTYAVRFYHDINENQKMDTTKRGIPTEPYGFSNNARGFMGAPKFKKMSFVLNQNQTMDLKFK